MSAADDCASPVDAAALQSYVADDLAPEEADAIDEHLFGCQACAARLERLESMRTAVRALAREGRVSTVVGASLTARWRADGVKVQDEDTATLGSTVRCTVAPGVDVLMARVIGLDLRGTERIDVEVSVNQQRVSTWEDFPADPASHEIVFTIPTQAAREAADGTDFVLKIVSVEPAGRRLIGECTFRHVDWSPHWRSG
jgi:hypothetical protein